MEVPTWLDNLLDEAAAGVKEEVAGATEEDSLATRISSAVDQLAERAVLQRLDSLSSQLAAQGF